MKKTKVLLALISLCVLTACGETPAEVSNNLEEEHTHEWTGGTCMENAVCEVCGMTGEKNPDNHSIIPATYTVAAHCSECAYTEGEALKTTVEYTEETSFDLPYCVVICDAETGEEKEDSIWEMVKGESLLQIEKMYTAPSKEEGYKDIYIECRSSHAISFRYDSSKYSYEPIYYKYEEPLFMLYDEYTGQIYPGRTMYNNDEMDVTFDLVVGEKSYQIKSKKSVEKRSEWGQVSAESDSVQATALETISKHVITVPNEYDGLRLCVLKAGVTSLHENQTDEDIDIEKLRTIYKDKDGEEHTMDEYIFVNPYDHVVEVASLDEVLGSKTDDEEVKTPEPVKVEEKTPVSKPAEEPAATTTQTTAKYNSPYGENNPAPTYEEAKRAIEEHFGMSYDEYVAYYGGEYGMDMIPLLNYGVSGWYADEVTGALRSPEEENALWTATITPLETDGSHRTGTCSGEGVTIIG